jgi:2-aminoadipate transaminase
MNRTSPGQQAQTSILRQLLSLVPDNDLISFALGLPSVRTLPNDAIADAVRLLLARDKSALQLGPPCQSLKHHIVRLMKRRGVSCSESQIFITSGAQQALDLLSRLYLEHGSPVVAEELSYTGFYQAIAPWNPTVESVSCDPQTGIDVNGVRALLRRGTRPGFLYLVPDGQNPLGVCLSESKRHQLVALARDFSLLLVEDDVYGLLHYDGCGLPPLRSLDDEMVIYIGSFSKILGPSLRTGWLVVPEALIPALSHLKDLIDIDCGSFSHRVVNSYLDSFDLDEQLSHIRRENMERRDIMLAAMSQFFPPWTRWTKPNAGLFIWVEVPHELDTEGLLATCLERERVVFVPDAAFRFPEAPHTMSGFRLSFCQCDPERIAEGIKRLGRLLDSQVSRGSVKSDFDYSCRASASSVSTETNQ